MTIEWNYIIRICIAGLLGAIIGFEREMRAKEAGIRTHFLVALGSALFMVISQFAFKGYHDEARVAAQVVSGIGFIGAGVIIFQKNAVRGITTAAGLWVAAAIGMTCGGEMYPLAIAATLLQVVCLEAMHFITRRFGEKTVTVSLYSPDSEQLSKAMRAIGDTGADIHSLRVEEHTAIFDLHVKQRAYVSTVEQILELCSGVKVDIS